MNVCHIYSRACVASISLSQSRSALVPIVSSHLDQGALQVVSGQGDKAVAYAIVHHIDKRKRGIKGTFDSSFLNDGIA